MDTEVKRPVLIVDDEESVSTMLAYWSEKIWKHPSIVSATGSDALEKLVEKPSVVLLDIMLPDLSGVDVLKWIKHYDKNLPVIMLSAQASVEVAVECLRAGAYDYFTKPIDRDRLHRVIENAVKSYEMAVHLEELEEILHERYTFDNIITVDPKMQDVFKLMRKAVESNITVTIQGESGTGKELIARALHFNSARKKGPFVVVNCAAIPKDLLESELFGHEKGAFTGAHEMKIGKFEAAKGGTLFLDEIGEMDLALQAKILRAIQQKEFQRVGATTTTQVDTRIVSATNRNLLDAVKQGVFREDLYYRLSTFPIYLPPLRERKSDIIALAEFFLKRFNEQEKKSIRSITREATVALTRYPWPGNIRELESAIERAILLCEQDKIDVEDLPLTIRGNLPAIDERTILTNQARKEGFLQDLMRSEDLMPLTELKKKYVDRAYDLCEGNISEASKCLGISRATFYRIMENKSERGEE